MIQKSATANFLSKFLEMLQKKIELYIDVSAQWEDPPGSRYWPEVEAVRTERSEVRTYKRPRANIPQYGSSKLG